jgi:hypothetical protein
VRGFRSPDGGVLANVCQMYSVSAPTDPARISIASEKVWAGLYRKDGDVYVATPKLARRALLRHRLPLRDRDGPWRLPKFSAVALGWGLLPGALRESPWARKGCC